MAWGPRPRRQALWPDAAAELYGAAGELAACAPLVGRGRAELTADERGERQRYTDLALAALRPAARHGYRDAERLRGAPEFLLLQPLPEFDDLLAVVQANAKAAEPKKE